MKHQPEGLLRSEGCPVASPCQRGADQQPHCPAAAGLPLHQLHPFPTQPSLTCLVTSCAPRPGLLAYCCLESSPLLAHPTRTGPTWPQSRESVHLNRQWVCDLAETLVLGSHPTDQRGAGGPAPLWGTGSGALPTCLRQMRLPTKAEPGPDHHSSAFPRFAAWQHRQLLPLSTGRAARRPPLADTNGRPLALPDRRAGPHAWRGCPGPGEPALQG